MMDMRISVPAALERHYVLETVQKMLAINEIEGVEIAYYGHFRNEVIYLVHYDEPDKLFYVGVIMGAMLKKFSLEP